MQRSLKLIVAAGCALLLTAACTSQPKDSDSMPDTQYRDLLPGVKIIYSANVNGEAEPCGCRSNPTGGIHRRWNLLEQKLQGEKLSIDSGDLFYQSIPVPPFLEKQWNYQAEALLKAYNAMGVEAMTPGELDFAAGLDQFERLKNGAKFKIIAANIFRRDNGKRLLDSHVILTRNGKRVALFGIYDESLPLPPELEARDRTAAARKMVDELRKKADVVIALTHQGLDKDQELARNVSGIDAIFGAHTQSYLFRPDKIDDTLIFQPSFRGQHVGYFADGKNGLYQMDARFDSPPGKPNPMDELLAQTKKDIAEINRATEAELLSEPAISKTAEYQTFPRCTECHAAQFKFHKKTAHFKAYETLVKAKQNSNLDCLKCHTVGMSQPGGWNNVKHLVFNAAGKPIDPESFAKSLPNMSVESVTKVSKAFINVQCETCHGPAGNHPFGGRYPKQVSTDTCLQCHTPNQAPAWYKGEKPDMNIIKTKLKSLSCPPAKME